MNYNYEITEDDYINFNLYHTKNSSANKMVYNMLCYVIPILFAFPIYLIGKKAFNQPAIYWVIVAVAFVLLWALTYPKRYTRLVKREALKALKKNASADILGNKSLSLENDSIKIAGEHSQDIINLSDITEKKVVKDMILLYLDANTAHIIPLNSFNQSEKDELLTILNIKK